MIGSVVDLTWICELNERFCSFRFGRHYVFHGGCRTPKSTRLKNDHTNIFLAFDSYL